MSAWSWLTSLFAPRQVLVPPPASDVLGAATLAAVPQAAASTPAKAMPKSAKDLAAQKSRGYRNRNPGNIDWSAGNNWVGQLGREEGGGRFARFDTHEHGIRALGKLLLSYRSKYGLKTIRQIINRWAPPVENATNNYVDRVAAFMRDHGPDDVLDLYDPAVMRGLVLGIITVELAGQPYDDAVIDAGVRLALA